MKEDRTARAMRVLSILDPTVTYKMMQLFLRVADAHPKGVLQSEIVGSLDPDRQNVSRWVRRLGDRPYYRTNNPKDSIALGLIHAQMSSNDQRVKLLTLTPKGMNVRDQIDDVAKD